MAKATESEDSLAKAPKEKLPNESNQVKDMERQDELHKKIAAQDVSFPDILRSKEDRVVLIKLPDYLPGEDRGMTDVPVGEKEKDRKQCELTGLPEGYIGKVQVMKSGKVKLLVNGVKFDLESGSQAGCLQELAKISMNEDGKSAEMTPLGHIQNKLVVSPDLEALSDLGVL